ncbi:hypothetical protein BPOR_0090g00110 [Botrytis porri]|uniref:Uncharacterized protein n=1 Tax=Botrytis porri TaxID=87229 RepID=A0A4Z1KZA9_9HELO|nr:hypothetical protein BPOR_0090g00110 [Botrytis porri]
MPLYVVKRIIVEAKTRSSRQSSPVLYRRSSQCLSCASINASRRRLSLVSSLDKRRGSANAIKESKPERNIEAMNAWNGGSLAQNHFHALIWAFPVFLSKP